MHKRTSTFSAAIIWSIALPLSCIAEPSVQQSIKLDTITIVGKTYTSAIIKKKDAAHAVVTHSDGCATVDLSSLSEDLQNRLGYNREAANQEIERQKASKESLEKAERIATRKAQIKVAASNQCENVFITVSSVEDTGLLGQRGKDGTIFIEMDTAGQGYLSDRIYRFRAREIGTFKYTTVLGASRSVPRFRTMDSIIKSLEKGDSILSEQ